MSEKPVKKRLILKKVKQNNQQSSNETEFEIRNKKKNETTATICSPPSLNPRIYVVQSKDEELSCGHLSLICEICAKKLRKTIGKNNDCVSLVEIMKTDETKTANSDGDRIACQKTRKF